jgi:hypothetical protein
VVTGWCGIKLIHVAYGDFVLRSLVAWQDLGEDEGSEFERRRGFWRGALGEVPAASCRRLVAERTQISPVPLFAASTSQNSTPPQRTSKFEAKQLLTLRLQTIQHPIDGISGKPIIQGPIPSSRSARHATLPPVDALARLSSFHGIEFWPLRRVKYYLIVVHRARPGAGALGFLENSYRSADCVSPLDDLPFR